MHPEAPNPRAPLPVFIAIAADQGDGGYSSACVTLTLAVEPLPVLSVVEQPVRGGIRIVTESPKNCSL